MTHLYLFQIGPVQAFIAQARRTADLYYGSTLLSMLARAGLQKAKTNTANFQAIFPYDPDTKGAPHRFAFVGDGEPAKVAEQVKDGIEEEWREVFAASF